MAEVALDGGRRTLGLVGIGHVAGITLGAGQFLLKRGEPRLASGQQRNAIAAFGEALRQRRSRSGTDTRDDANLIAHGITSRKWRMAAA